MAERLDRRSTGLSLAVRLTDAFSGGRPVGRPRVRIAERDSAPIRTPGGHWVFLDEPAGSVTLEVDAGDRYFDETREGVDVVSLPDESVDPRDPSTLPVVDVELLPSPAYRFPAGLTRLRGRVEAADGTPIAGATLSVPGLAPETRSTDDGEFVLYFPDLGEEDVYEPADEDDDGPGNGGPGNGGQGNGGQGGGQGNGGQGGGQGDGGQGDRNDGDENGDQRDEDRLFVTDGDGDPEVKVVHDSGTTHVSVAVEVGALTVRDVTVE